MNNYNATNTIFLSDKTRSPQILILLPVKYVADKHNCRYIRIYALVW